MNELANSAQRTDSNVNKASFESNTDIDTSKDVKNNYLNNKTQPVSPAL